MPSASVCSATGQNILNYDMYIEKNGSFKEKTPSLRILVHVDALHIHVLLNVW